MTINAEDILAVTEAVTKKWTKQRKAEERGSRSRYSRVYVYSDRVNFTDVAARILPDAYKHASGDGRYTVSKRQMFYSSRNQFKDATGRELEYGYFAGTLLVQYMNRHPETVSAWKITADPRGTLELPNAGHPVRVPCGTVQIDNHLRHAARLVNPMDLSAELPVEWPSLRHGERYQAVLYIEKEGFDPLLKEADIANRFDLAILSCKGQSVGAARKFVDEVCRVDGGVPLFVVHDFDKYGFEISQRLTSVSEWAEDNDRVVYQFRNEINVVDLGLRLDDVQEYELEGEDCAFNGGFAPDSIAAAEEKEYLQAGRRVELNELTAPQFLEWLEGKLLEHLPGRLLPSDDVLAAAYRRAHALALINRAIEDVRSKAIAEAESLEVPAALRDRLEEAMGLPTEESDAWDVALYELVKKQALSHDTD